MTVSDTLDVHVVLDIIHPTAAVNLGKLAVYVVTDPTDTSAAPIKDVIIHSADDLANMGLSVDASTEAIIDAYFAQDNHGDSVYLYGVASSVDQSNTKTKIEDTITDGWEFATIISATANDSVVLANEIEQYGRKFAVLGMKTDAAEATYDEIAAIESAPFYGNSRTIIFVANGGAGESEHYKAVGALIGALGNLTPGSITWKFKTLKTVTPSVVNGTVLNKATELGVNLYVTKAGTAQTSEGMTTSGEYIDNLHADDWIRAEMETSIQTLLTTTDKLPYGAEGIAQLSAAATTVLRQATDNGIILVDPETNAGSFTVTSGSRDEQEASDISARKYKGLSFTYVRAGAIHDVTVHGTISDV